jgi:hypothetical protein
MFPYYSRKIRQETNLKFPWHMTKESFKLGSQCIALHFPSLQYCKFPTRVPRTQDISLWGSGISIHRPPSPLKWENKKRWHTCWSVQEVILMTSDHISLVRTSHMAPPNCGLRLREISVFSRRTWTGIWWSEVIFSERCRSIFTKQVIIYILKFKVIK